MMHYPRVKAAHITISVLGSQLCTKATPRPTHGTLPKISETPLFERDSLRTSVNDAVFDHLVSGLPSFVFVYPSWLKPVILRNEAIRRLGACDFRRVPAEPRIDAGMDSLDVLNLLLELIREGLFV